MPNSALTTLGASAMAALAVLPVFLLSSQSVFVRAELGFDERAFGLAVSMYWAAAAAVVLVGGRLVDRLGRKASTVTAALIAATGGFSLAFLTHSWSVLVLTMLVLGSANAALQVTANLTMATAIPIHRRGLGFGVKQASIPLALMIAGLTVPFLSANFGWRLPFFLTGLGAVGIFIAGLRQPTIRVERPTNRVTLDRPSVPGLIIAMVAVALASGAFTSLASFLPAWGIQVGLTPGEAGLLLAAGSGGNIVMRIAVGHLADRRDGRNLPIVALQMLTGALSLGLLSIPSQFAAVLGGVLALLLGWSWPGLMLFAVVRLGRDTPGGASSYIQAGASVGAALGPALFGFLVATINYQVAWRSAAMLCFAAALLVLLSRRVFVADLMARPPRPADPHH
jgi:MFS family permease